MDNLKHVVESERRRDPKGFAKAERNGDLLAFLRPALLRAKVDPALLSKYNENGVVHSVEAMSFNDYVELASSTLDEIFFEPLYQHQLPNNNLGIADAMTTFRSAGHISGTLKKVKVFSAVTSLLTFALSIRYGMMRWIPHAIVLLIVAVDLFRISFNCYEKKYCSLFLNSIGGNAAKLTETIFKFAKLMVGASDPADDPLVRLRSEIIWGNLIQDTICLGLYHKAGEALKK